MLQWHYFPNETSILIASITERHDNYAHFDLREQGFKDFFKNSTSRLLEYKSIDQKDEVIKEQLSEFLKKHPPGISMSFNVNLP